MQASNVIGHGGFGKVYKGCVDGKEVAIKMVSTAEKGEVRPARVQRAMDTLLAELNIGSRLQQGTEHIVRLFGWSHQADGTVCLVYEYANMGSLTEIPEETDLPAALRLFSQYAKGLAYMHDRKTLHGDLKPGNLLLHRSCDGTWVGRLGDLGLSQIVHTGSQGGLKHTGTRGYLAPELGGHAGRPRQTSTYRSDVYAFGVTMGSLLSGMEPEALAVAARTVGNPVSLPAARRAAVLDVEKKVHAEFEEVAACAPIIRSLVSLVLACCSPLPEKRPDAAQVASKLEEVASSRTDGGD